MLIILVAWGLGLVTSLLDTALSKNLCKCHLLHIFYFQAERVCTLWAVADRGLSPKLHLRVLGLLEDKFFFSFSNKGVSHLVSEIEHGS